MIDKKTILNIAWTQAIIATSGSLFLSLVLHWTPCVLCWYQRILMYPLVLVIAAGILKEIEDIEYVVLPMTFVGLGISIYHNLLMYKIIPESAAPCTADASCNIPYHFIWGFLTVPLLSLIAFTVITVCMFMYHFAKKKNLS
jgi:disulfide bond formation protein DsbB